MTLVVTKCNTVVLLMMMNSIFIEPHSHAKLNSLSALPTVTPPAGLNSDRNNGCDFDIQMHSCLDRF